jgi:hypothetical protein
MSATDFLIGVADHRRDQSLRRGDGDADVDLAVLRDRVVAPARVHRRMVTQRERDAADDEIVETDLHAADLDQLLPHREQVRDVVIGGEIEMRDRSRRLGKPLRDRAAHRRKRNDFRLEHRSAGACTERSRSVAGWPGGVPPPLCNRFRVLDVGSDDASARTAPLHAVETDAEVARHTPRQRRGTKSIRSFLRRFRSLGSLGRCDRDAVRAARSPRDTRRWCA